MAHIPYKPRPAPQRPVAVPSTLAPLASLPHEATSDLDVLPLVPINQNKPPVGRVAPVAADKGSLGKISMRDYTVKPDAVAAYFGLGK